MVKDQGLALTLLIAYRIETFTVNSLCSDAISITVVGWAGSYSIGLAFLSARNKSFTLKVLIHIPVIIDC